MPKRAPATIDDLVKQVKTTNRLLAAQLKTQMSQMELVELLGASGLTAKEVGEILNTTPATISVTLQRLKNRRAKRINTGS